jgi:hypothetical protein
MTWEVPEQMEPKQHAEAGAYQLDLPRQWDVQHFAGDFLYFQHDSHKVGGVEVLGFYPGQTVQNLLPNHSQVLEATRFQGHEEGYRVRLTIEPPAAEGAQGQAVHQLHFYFPAKHANLAYDLFFNLDTLPDGLADRIAASFLLKA